MLLIFKLIDSGVGVTGVDSGVVVTGVDSGVGATGVDSCVGVTGLESGGEVTGVDFGVGVTGVHSDGSRRKKPCRSHSGYPKLTFFLEFCIHVFTRDSK